MNKIAICGKGGVGKSLMVYLISKAMIDKNCHVLIVDADESNTGVHKMFGFPNMPQSFMECLGGKKVVQQTMLKRFRNGKNEPEMSVIEKEQFNIGNIGDDYIVKEGPLSFIVIGKIYHPMEGCACPMGAVSTAAQEVRAIIGKIFTR